MYVCVCVRAWVRALMCVCVRARAYVCVCACTNSMCGCGSPQIGPGTGNLTRHLLDSGAAVTAVEKDDVLFSRLLDTFSSSIKVCVWYVCLCVRGERGLYLSIHIASAHCTWHHDTFMLLCQVPEAVPVFIVFFVFFMFVSCRQENLMLLMGMSSESTCSKSFKK